MDRDDLLGKLRALETTLRSPESQERYRALPEGDRRRLVAERAELSLLIERLTTSELSAIATKLDELARELKRAIAEVDRRLEPLDRPVAALNALARLLGLVARIAVLGA